MFLETAGLSVRHLTNNSKAVSCSEKCTLCDHLHF